MREVGDYDNFILPSPAPEKKTPWYRWVLMIAGLTCAIYSLVALWLHETTTVDISAWDRVFNTVLMYILAFYMTFDFRRYDKI